MLITSLFFDMDGVVIDSEKLHLKALGLTLDNNGIAYPAAMLPGFTGKSDRSFFEYARDYLDTDGRVDINKFLNEKDKLFDSLLPELRFVDGFEDFILAVKARDLKTALVTSSSRWTVNKVDKLLGILKWFDVVIAEEDTERHKPNPDPYLLAFEKTEADRESTIIIEDSTIGITAGKAAGCTVCGLTTSFTKEVLTGAGADHAFDSYNALASTLF